MIDTAATHSYLASAEVERLGLVLEKEVTQVKAINSAAQPIAGVAKSVLIKDVMPDELHRKLLPKKAVAHEIELVPGTKPPARAPYIMSQPELVKLSKQLKDMLESGIIKPAKSPYGASVLFQKKANGSLRMCCDYRALNKVTVKNKYPIQLVTNCFDRLSQAKYFTKIDLRSGYWQVRIKEGDEVKTTVVTMYGSFEFIIMPFDLTNAPTTFCTLMNQKLHGFLDEFVVVYLDDIVIYSRTLAEHVEHLRQVLARLREYELYAKVSKCSFAQETISFLGHIVER
ncbi:UNVERIFIED_CONTAM: RNA-directed DNA polymerase [Sesamum radiatum]|uniref:RNA-directed DNA polymerase n=1 Tax=Sesamum radiatum TaxID=300843 RepID=A0AAW2PJK1_SESRA